MKIILDSLQQFLEPIGQQIAYRFSLAPRWFRASFWAATMVAFLVGICLAFVMFVMWLIDAIGGERLIGLSFLLGIFLFFLYLIWDDIPAQKSKNDDPE